jgi:hypothetical protein
VLLNIQKQNERIIVKANKILFIEYMCLNFSQQQEKKKKQQNQYVEKKWDKVIILL